MSTETSDSGFSLVETMIAIPREIRPDMTILATFGPSAVVRNGRPGSDPEHALCASK